MRYMIKSCGSTWMLDLETQILLYQENRSLVDRMKKRTNKKIIALQDIEEIEILWNDMPIGLYGLVGHGIIFKVKSKFLDIFTFCAYAGYTGYDSEKEEFLQATKALVESGVRVIDHYGLLQVLEDPNIRLASYIDEIVKERGKRK